MSKNASNTYLMWCYGKVVIPPYAPRIDRQLEIVINDEDCFHNWVDKKKLLWYYLCANPNAIEIIEDNYDKVLSSILGNPSAQHIIERMLCENAERDGVSYEKRTEALNELQWNKISQNPSLIYLLEENLEKVNWTYLSANPNAIHLLEANPDKINWDMLSSNPNAIHLLEANPEKIDWLKLSANPNAIHILEANPKKINVFGLHKNPYGELLFKKFKIYSNCFASRSISSLLPITETLSEYHKMIISNRCDSNYEVISELPCIFKTSEEEYPMLK